MNFEDVLNLVFGNAGLILKKRHPTAGDEKESFHFSAAMFKLVPTYQPVQKA